ncbi:MAG: hypothetical protein AAF697_09340 [Pseudomonadota bacterium]
MLLQKVEKFLRENEMAATRFGRLAAGDPRFVLDLRMGRMPRARTVERTLQWMARFEGSSASKTGAAHAPAPQSLETKAYSYAV